MTGQLSNGPDLNTEIDPGSFSWAADRHFCAIAALTGLDLDPYDFPRSVLGLDGYVGAIMSTQTEANQEPDFAGLEFVKPAHADWLLRLYPGAHNDPVYGPVLLPARFAWPRIGLLALVLQRCRNASRDRIVIRYLWCPEPFGTEAGHAKQSDHLSATAADIWFPSAKSWSRILHLVLAPIWEANLLAMSWGWNSKVSNKFHVGFFDPKTLLKGEQRRWDYYKR